ncbi:MAG: NYN domain-containing protein [Gammaproteobacteria bacterium]|nr:NYN domain-containing protein [Gammaproteobacteria bacterium]
METVAIFVDVQNIYYTVREVFQKNFDYNAFWREATADRNIVEAFAYAVDRGDEKQRQFQHILKAIGFSVKLKPYIQRQDGSSKGDWDVGIAIDIMELSPKVDRVILLSGDGDFAILMEKIKQAHKTITEVYGVRALTANALINSVDCYREITDRLLLGR